MANATAVETLDFPTIVTEVDKAIAVTEDVIDVVQKFQSFLPANIEAAVLELQSVLTALQAVASKV